MLSGAAAASATVAAPEELLLLGFEGGFLGHEVLEAGEPARGETPVVDGGANGAAGLLVVFAVAEPAVVHQVEHIGESPARCRRPTNQRLTARTPGVSMSQPPPGS